jgi:Response regulator containing CheY-like receiver, AAA-type ATPase, and DNA-binding domains
MSTGTTILIADDDRAIRTVLHQALAGRATMCAARGGRHAWQWVQEGEGQLVITDVVMPDENGLDLVPRIRKLRPDLRIIVMSAQSTLLRPCAPPSAAPSNTCPSRLTSTS